jgi:hypothetical protein
MGDGPARQFWVILATSISPQRGNHYNQAPVQTLESNGR